MNRSAILAFTFLAFVATVSSKDKGGKVSYHDMAVGMRDAFNCGVVVEEHLHGRLKDQDEAYHQDRATNNCDRVEAILNSLDAQDGSR